ncbi:zinc finger CCCH-type antiviral protein 1-like isoform X2 [Takifugu flavidus]|uniref:zinc finger CCCH-type antiviral protein 1-like isoform X2 n=1 Tax=Takifugu flavidus TaxID=433684 RepID=UPI002544B4EB|nr:zinc finger CCCH-type antiviral protein 1-like isoform X2 [Takifugu flavidus]
MEKGILKIICASQGAVDTDFLVCNLGSSVLEILSSSDKCLPCCPFRQPKVVARTKVRVCRTRDCPGSCQALHLCKNFLFSGSCQFNLNRRGCVFSHELDSGHNEAILKEHELEHLSKTELCTLLLQSDNHLLPQLCHHYNTGDDVVFVFGGCKEGFACKRLHVCEKFLNTSCNCSRNHGFHTPQTLNLLQGVPHDLAFKSIYANIQALKYYDIQSNRAKSGNQQLQVNKGNTNQVKKPSFSTNDLEDNTDAECQQQPAEGAVSTTTMGAEANSCDEQLPLVTPRLPVPGTYQQSSKGSVGTLTSVIPAAVNADAHQQLQRATATSL